MHLSASEGGTLTLELCNTQARALITETDHVAMQRWETNITKSLRLAASIQRSVRIAIFVAIVE